MCVKCVMFRASEASPRVSESVNNGNRIGTRPRGRCGRLIHGEMLLLHRLCCFYSQTVPLLVYWSVDSVSARKCGSRSFFGTLTV